MLSDPKTPTWASSRPINSARSSSISWLVDEYIPSNTVTLLSSVSGSGKSVLALHLGLCLAHGIDWLGLKCKRSVFGYWDQDNPDAWLTDNRICALGRGLGLTLPPDSFVFRTNGRVLGDDRRLRQLIAWLLDLDITVLFVDTLTSVSTYREGDPNEMSKVIVDNFFPMVEAGITPIVLHHIGKDFMDQTGHRHRRTGIHAPRGSTALVAAVGAAFNLDKETDIRRLECVKPRYGLAPTLKIEYDEEFFIGSDDWKITISSPRRLVSQDFVTQFVKDGGHESVSSRKLVQLLKDKSYHVSQSTASRALSRVKHTSPI